jgi:AAA family ATP:ADP antiporter
MRQSVQYTAFENLLRLFTRVRPGEGRCVAMFFGHVFLILFCYYVFKSLREALVMSGAGAEMRSYAQAATAGILMLLIPLYSALRRRVDGARLVNTVMWFFVVALAAFWALGTSGVPIGFAFFVLIGIFAVMVVAQFWALAADSFNVKSGQRLFPVITVGAALGAVLGAKFTESMVEALGPYPLVLVATGVLALGTLLTHQMQEAVPEGSRSLATSGPSRVQHWLGGFAVVGRSKYLMLIALFMVLINLVSTTGDSIHSYLVKQHFTGLVATGALDDAGADRATAHYFGSFYFWMTIAQFAIQMFVVSRLFRLVGVGGALLALPLVAVAGYTLVAFVPILSVIRAVRLSEMSLEYSVNGTSRNALFLPTGKAETYDGKTTIETFFWRFGDLLSAGAVAASLHFFHRGAIDLVTMNVIAAAAAVGVGVLIGREYRRLALLNLHNEAPTVTCPIPCAELLPGRPFEHLLPDGLFADSDPGDVLTLTARMRGGEPLPDWLRFDAVAATFRGDAAPHFDDEIYIEVIATDNDGVTATGVLIIRRAGDIS